MEIRKATPRDRKAICIALAKKNIPWSTTTQAKADIENGNLYVATENEKILAIVSLVYDNEWNYTGIKRLCILNKKNEGKGIAKMLVSEVIKGKGKVGLTPWADNVGMQKLAKSLGFEYQYTFDEKWTFFEKIA